VEDFFFPCICPIHPRPPSTTSEFALKGSY
jgi:hypothetical protein